MNLSKLLELTFIAGTGITESRESLNAYTEMVSMIKQSMLEEETSKSGGNKEKDRLKAAQKYILNVEEKNKKRFGGVSHQHDKQWICNGYSCISLNKPITGLTEVENPIEFKNVLPDYNSNLYTKIEYTLDIPKLKLQLREAIAEEKANGGNKKDKTRNNNQSDKRMFQLGNQWFSIELFLSIVAIIPGKYTYYQYDTSTENVQPFVFTTGEEVAMILPVRMAKSQEVDNNES